LSEKRALSTIAAEIYVDWKPINFAAAPYLREFARLSACSDSDPDLGFPNAGFNFVRGFLGNAGTWRGDVARRVKAELKLHLKSVSK
jgi:hypothetical protein